MLGIITAYDENEKSAAKEKISFVHFNSSSEKDIKIEVAPISLALARKYDLKKVYLFYGEKGKIIYEYD